MGYLLNQDVKDLAAGGSDWVADETPNPQFTGAQTPGTSQQYIQGLSETSKQDSNQDSGGGGGYDASKMLDDYGIASSEKSSLFKKYGVDNTPDLIDALKAEEKQRAEQRKKDAVNIGKAWDPIFSELDNQLKRLPGRQTEQESRVSSLADMQLGDVEGQRTQGIEALEFQKNRGLRDLEENIRNQMSAAQRIIGGLGGGGSSALQASEAITRAGTRGRTNLLETVTREVSKVNALAAQERSKIQQWKAQSVFDIAQYFNDRLDQLEMMKANAKGERARAIADLQFNIEQQFAQRLSELDNTVINYAQTVEAWERQRTAELQDYARRSTASVANTDWDRVVDENGEIVYVSPQGDIKYTGVYAQAGDDPDKIITSGIYNEPYRVTDQGVEQLQGFPYTPSPFGN